MTKIEPLYTTAEEARWAVDEAAYSIGLRRGQLQEREAERAEPARAQ